MEYGNIKVDLLDQTKATSANVVFHISKNGQIGASGKFVCWVKNVVHSECFQNCKPIPKLRTCLEAPLWHSG